MISPRAFLVGVVVAALAGLLASLALRPPGGQAPTPGASDLPSATMQLVHWRVPSAFGTNLPALGDNILYVEKTILAASGDRIHLQPFEPGELVPAFSITDSVREGKLPAGYVWLGYDQGKLPVSTLFSAVPFGFEPWEYLAWWYEAGGEGLASEIYADYGLEIMLCGIIGPETAGWFREPLESLDDVRGLKIRFAGLGGMVLERLGASVTLIPGGEIFQALEKGAIDATEYSLPVVDERLGFDQVAQHNLFPGWHQPFTAFHLVVNPATWESLTSADQALIHTGCTAGVTRNLASSEALQGSVLAGFPAKGVRAQQLPEEILLELNRVTEAVLDEEAADDPVFARVLEHQRAFRAESRQWTRLGYLPRDFAERVEAAQP